MFLFRKPIGRTCVLAGLLGFFAVNYPTFLKADEAETTVRKGRNTTREIGDTDVPDDKRDAKTIEQFVFFEFRPTFDYTIGSAHTENTAEYGVLFYQKTKLSYVQLFASNLYQSQTHKSIFRAPRFRLNDGYLKVKLSDLWQSSDEKSKFSLQVRAYLPTNAATESSYSRYDQGMITTVRTYLIMDQDFSNFVSGEFSLVPTVFFVRKGSYTYEGQKFAAATYETQIVSEIDLKFTESLVLQFPLVIKMTRFGNVDKSALFKDDWRFQVLLTPELDWEYIKNQTAGIAYNPDSFITKNFKSSQFSKAFNNSNVQLVWNIKF